MRSALLLAVVAVVLAGCSEEGVPAAAPSATGSSSASESGAPSVLVVEMPSLAVVEWTGRTKEGAWVCSDASGTGSCPAGQQVAPDGGHATLVAYQGRLSSVALNVTWTPADPSQTGLVFAVYGNTTSGFTLLWSGQGASPLVVALDAAALGDVVPDGGLVLMAWPAGKTPTQPSVFVDATRQAFDVDGELRSVVPVPVEMA